MDLDVDVDPDFKRNEKSHKTKKKKKKKKQFIGVEFFFRLNLYFTTVQCLYVDCFSILIVSKFCVCTYIPVVIYVK